MAATDGWESIAIPHTWNAIDGEAGGGAILDQEQSLTEATAAAAARKAKRLKTDDLDKS